MTALEIRGATPEPFLIPLPDDLNRRVEQLILEAGGPLSANQFERAAELSEELYLLMLGAQPPGKRFHKGWPLHNRGLAFALTSKGKLAAVSFLLAFIEDAISRAEESPTKLDELDRPAARVLALVLDQSTLVAAATSVRERFASGERQRMRNPGRISSADGND